MAGELLNAPWPEVDNSALATATLVLAVQVNGRLRGQIEVAADAGEEQIRDTVLADEKIARHASAGAIRKVILVPGKLVNIVV
jgi:leucyl-tRNA synthetase